TPPAYLRSHQCIFGPTRMFLIPPAHFQLHPPSLPLHLYIPNPPPRLQRCARVFSPHPPCPPVFDPLSVSSPARVFSGAFIIPLACFKPHRRVFSPPQILPAAHPEMPHQCPTCISHIQRSHSTPKRFTCTHASSAPPVSFKPPHSQATPSPQKQQICRFKNNPTTTSSP
ncbi:hypothetical protein PAXRUDRAFT_156516, partial [Paxillus rubicundulus Ve08.2h10]